MKELRRRLQVAIGQGFIFIVIVGVGAEFSGFSRPFTRARPPALVPISLRTKAPPIYSGRSSAVERAAGGVAARWTKKAPLRWAAAALAGQSDDKPILRRRRRHV